MKLVYFQQAVTALERVATENPSVLNYQHAVARESARVTVMLERAGRIDEAVESQEKAVEHSEGVDC